MGNKIAREAMSTLIGGFAMTLVAMSLGNEALFKGAPTWVLIVAIIFFIIAIGMYVMCYKIDKRVKAARAEQKAREEAEKAAFAAEHPEEAAALAAKEEQEWAEARKQLGLSPLKKKRSIAAAAHYTAPDAEEESEDGEPSEAAAEPEVGAAPESTEAAEAAGNPGMPENPQDTVVPEGFENTEEPEAAADPEGAEAGL
ncbi:MAG: hypothetical protein IJL66_05570 [Lachnospiraceae bacterium]|nr:hypothetical protein [Lachnospiraceae bacterium]